MKLWGFGCVMFRGLRQGPLRRPPAFPRNNTNPVPTEPLTIATVHNWLNHTTQKCLPCGYIVDSIGEHKAMREISNIWLEFPQISFGVAWFKVPWASLESTPPRRVYLT